MKNVIVFVSVFLLLSLLRCTQNEPTAPEENTGNSGKLFLNIDKQNAPESVVWLEAFLIRQGYDTISGGTESSF